MKRSHDVAIDEKVEFSALLQNKQLLQGLKRAGYDQPSPVQLKAIPLGRLGVDLIAQAKSGTGKTVVFGVITLEAIRSQVTSTQALIVAPTREIAIQIRDVIRLLAVDYKPPVSCHAFIGGLSMQADLHHLSKCQIVVGTPGRLMALIATKKFITSELRLIVLDEADKLMSDTFFPQVEYIISNVKGKKTLQTVAFSATFHDSLLQTLSGFMKEPQIVKLTDGIPTLAEVQQYYLKILVENTSKLAIYKSKFEALEKLLSQVPFYQCMIFVNSVPRSMELTAWLNEMGWKSGLIHAGLTQEKRLTVMENMRDFKIRILVCSDLIARGIDIDKVNLVINVDFPWEIETYLHRVGRTGRFGTSGIAVNLIGPEDEAFLEQLLKKGITVHPLPGK
ncbi:P-loop containing nucleoside triphosphate hydrolase protein [Cokeromyces recurvatus]|uniref:P-loop containing nucleoside triphosphate hydrolase protein n=1 Tax=Cokeromyces recurvatus TaxID=90255 RepID=UPI0022208D82|nr:P-loop containing nucleoside triphosphate hydrolase protein [Cokeromyces recurvatus]KAI7899691.1 P-loop containing nucleoside triphosphate hydrolase protein [Cokeromyces recurvatus]